MKRYLRGAVMCCGVLVGVLVSTCLVGLTYRADVIEQGHVSAPKSAQIEAVAKSKTSLSLSDNLRATVAQVAAHYKLDESLVLAVIEVESCGDPLADNGQCVGLMQLDKQYASTFCAGAHVQGITSPTDNITAGCWWLSQLLNAYNGDIEHALAAYNLGQTKADELWASGARSTVYTHKVLEAIQDAQ